MALSDIFKIPEKLSSGQVQWLKMLVSIPDTKELMGDTVTDEDRELAKDARELLESKGITP